MAMETGLGLMCCGTMILIPTLIILFFVLAGFNLHRIADALQQKKKEEGKW
jgi:hypothetical protein